MIKYSPEISISPLVEYIGASDKRKRTIIKQQKNPPSIIVARYRSVRSTFANFLKNNCDKTVISDAITKFQNKEIITKWQQSDKENSLKALRQFINLEFPFQSLKCHFAKPSCKQYLVNGVNLIVSPDLILFWEIDGIKYAGAIKFYIKQKALSLEDGQLAISILMDFMQNSSGKEVVIDEKYCLYVDVMNERVFSGLNVSQDYLNKVSNACDEIRNLWLNN